MWTAAARPRRSWRRRRRSGTDRRRAEIFPSRASSSFLVGLAAHRADPLPRLVVGPLPLPARECTAYAQKSHEILIYILHIVINITSSPFLRSPHIISRPLSPPVPYNAPGGFL